MDNKQGIITSSRYLPNIGGIENSLYNLSRALRNAGWHIDVVASNVTDPKRIPLPQVEFEDNGIRVIRYSYYFFHRPSALWSYITGLYTYRKLCKDRDYDLVVCRNHVTVILCKLSGLKNIIYVLPGVVKVQNNPFSSGLKRGIFHLSIRSLAYFYHHALQWLAVRVAYKNVVFSEVVKKQLKDHLGYSGSVYNTKPGIDSKRFNIAVDKEKKLLRKSLGFRCEDVVVLGVGRFVEAKRFDYLIKSLIFLPDNFKVLLVGSGKLLDKYEEIISDNHLESRVKIVSATDKPENYYKCADIYVLSSTHETLGQTLLEAQASGLPVVAFSPDIAGVELATCEVVDATTALLAEELSEESIACEIIKAYENLTSGKFDSAKIRDFAVRNFSWDAMAKDLISLSS